MKTFLDNIRGKRKAALDIQMIHTVAILLLGIALGVFSKFLDSTASGQLPLFLEYLDVRNFLGRFAIWMLLGLCIAVYSYSPYSGSDQCVCFLSWNGYQLLPVCKACCRVLFTKLCTCMGRIYADFTVAGIDLLVCEGSRENLVGDFFVDHRYPF